MVSQFIWLFVLPIPIACIAWTVTHEEIFKEPRDYCKKKSENCNALWKRKFFYLFTCEYCFSHYVSLFIVVLTKYQLLIAGWRGHLLALFALVWIANVYMSLFALLRQNIKLEKIKNELVEEALEAKKNADT